MKEKAVLPAKIYSVGSGSSSTTTTTRLERFHDLDYGKLKTLVSRTVSYEARFSGTVLVSCLDPLTNRRFYKADYPIAGQQFWPSRFWQEYMENQPPEWLMRKLQKHGYVTSYIEDMQIQVSAIQREGYFRNHHGDFDLRRYSLLAEEILGIQNPCCFKTSCMEALAGLAVIEFMRETAENPFYKKVYLRRHGQTAGVSLLFHNHEVLAADNLPEEEKNLRPEFSFFPAFVFGTCKDWDLKEIEVMSTRRIPATKDSVQEELELHLELSPGQAHVHVVTGAKRDTTTSSMGKIQVQEVVRLDRHQKKCWTPPNGDPDSTKIYRFHDVEYGKLKTLVSSTVAYEARFSGTVLVSCLDPLTERRWNEIHHLLRRNPLIEETTGWHRLPQAAPKLNFMFLNFNKEQFQLYKDKPKILFTFQKQYSHDYTDRLRGVDTDMSQYIKWFNSNTEVHNTTVLACSYELLASGNYMNVQGLTDDVVAGVEAMLEFLNTKMLTTISDLHKTIKHLALHNPAETPPGTGVSEEAKSLLQPVPKTRTCYDAGVPMHLCGCEESTGKVDSVALKKLPMTNMELAKAGLAVIEFMRKTAEKPFYDKLYLRRHGQTAGVSLLFHNHEVLAADYLPEREKTVPHEFSFLPAFVFGTCKDWDLKEIEVMSIKRIPATKDSVNLNSGPVRVQVLVTGAKRDTTTSIMGHIQVQEVVRLDRYSHTGKCVKSWEPSLESFCYCLSNDTTPTLPWLPLDGSRIPTDESLSARYPKKNSDFSAVPNKKFATHPWLLGSMSVAHWHAQMRHISEEFDEGQGRDFHRDPDEDERLKKI
ncbi:unnamed protein product [Notodromas monacha]|uniref:Uncharacterized protein n=1 Tax=Notodromas monacha TaxID=399045 RepID=A0A7R9BTL9_9CRUS|nr:unnamed protein product [Notodromas monacha]CAG0920451.1 unnamed protein product [Notodromas monacha]